ncbi:hypothetical protein AGMMS4952_14780 [Spirochaetia bacterium]|nr:hypothetical protein AGMMS4952_14780 [Spirochaetia bacterium]
MNATDSVTLDIVKDSLIAIGDEVFYAFAQTSMSPIIYETLDYACGIADVKGDLLTQGNGACGFIGMISPMIGEVIEKFGKETMKSGDVYLINDPYMGGGTHLSDIGMVMPVFYRGEIIAFVGNKAHWSDVGGMAAGSFTTNSTEVFQEGLRFSGVKLVDAGEINPSLTDMIAANVRFPVSANGDMWGQIASLRTGFNRLVELCDKYGKEVLLKSMARLMDQGEQAARTRLAEMPKGSWEAEQFMDDDGHGNLVKIKVKVTITEKNFIADFSGSSPQVVSPINTGYSSLGAGVKVAYMSIINPGLSVNDGVFRTMEVIAEEASVLKCKAPAPTSCYFESMLYALDTVWKALAPVFPEYLGAGHMLSVCAVILAGNHHKSGLPFLIVEPTGGGWGASRGKDGEVGRSLALQHRSFLGNHLHGAEYPVVHRKAGVDDRHIGHLNPRAQGTVARVDGAHYLGAAAGKIGDKVFFRDGHLHLDLYQIAMPVIIHELLRFPGPLGHLRQPCPGGLFPLIHEPGHGLEEYLLPVFVAEFHQPVKAGSQGGDLPPHIAVGGNRKADVCGDHIREGRVDLPGVHQFYPGKPEPLLEDLGGVGGKGTGGHAPHIGPVGLVSHKGDDLPPVEHGHHHADIRKMGAAPHVGIVDEVDIPALHGFLAEFLDDFPDHGGYHADEPTGAVALGEEIPLHIGDPAGIIQGFIDDGTHRCLGKGVKHLVPDSYQ